MRRELQATATVRAQVDTARATKRGTLLGGIAPAVSLLAFIAAMASYRLAFMDDAGDRQWRAEQQHAAEQQAQLLTATRDRLPPAPLP